MAQHTTEYLTAEGVAALLGVEKQWIYQETRSGRIPHLKVGRKYRYKRDAIDRWIEQEMAG